jgi:hypothetical protein
MHLVLPGTEKGGSVPRKLWPKLWPPLCLATAVSTVSSMNEQLLEVPIEDTAWYILRDDHQCQLE